LRLVLKNKKKRESFNNLIKTGLQTCYCGFDPTASSLHIGNLLAIIFLIHCQRAGHTPIVVIGSATALIGDPSGRSQERNQMNNNEIISNTEKIQNKIANIFNNHEQLFWTSDKMNQNSLLPRLKYNLLITILCV
jgi:tyrosyl-tRNA synthetase